MIPHRTPFFLPLLYPSLTWRMPSDESVLYLTFDDGPIPGPTEFVLDELRRSSIRATFFCIGDNVRKHPDIFSAILADGHTVGNHTVNHLNGWRTTTDRYVANAKSFDAIAAEAGLPEPTALFRPPYGQISYGQLRMLSDYRVIMWDVLTQDYRRALRPEECLRRTISACRPGSIIVFHDSVKAQRNMEFALPRLIEHFRAKDYRFEAIPAKLPDAS